MIIRRAVQGFAILVVLALAFVIFVSLRPVGTEPDPALSGAPATLTDPLARGQYLARAADCVACHTAPGGKEFAGGLAFQLPFGKLYASNISADRDTGIGAWSDDQFVAAVRQGISPHGNLYPAMPYTSYTAMSRDDVLAIKAYLFSLEPISQANRPTELSFPFNQRWGMKFWNLVFFRDQRFTPQPEQTAQWNRGAYLATALGHCDECHTPRNLAFAMDSSRNLGGADIQGWSAYNISADAGAGIGAWSDEQLLAYLSTGHAQGRSTASGPMSEVIEHSLSHLDSSDIQALAVYLRSVKALPGSAAAVVNPAPATLAASTPLAPGKDSEDSLGKRLFAGDCAGCHLWNGMGRQSPYASLLGGRSVNDPSGKNVVQAILHGTRIKVGDWHDAMPSFGTYSDAEVAQVANYVIGQFGGKTATVTAEQVASQRKVQ